MTTYTGHQPAEITPLTFRKLYRHDDRVAAVRRTLTRVLILAVAPPVALALFTLATRR